MTPRPQQSLEGSLIEVIANEGGFTEDQLLSGSRLQALTNVRQIACWFARNEWGLSYPEAAQLVGRTDHTTAMHSVRKVDRLLAAGDEWTTAFVRRVHLRLATQTVEA